MNIEIGPGRAGEPVLYIDNHPVAEVHDAERMNAILQRLERYEEALKYYEQCDLVITSHNCDAGNRAREALKE